MPRPVWSGAISFGLVNVPVKVVTATEDHSIRFHQYHLEDMGRVRTRKICEIEDREVAADEIGKGYEISTDQIVPVTDEDLAEMPLPTAKAIEIVAFVPRETIDPLQISAGYFLEVDGQVATKPYVLLRKALERNQKVAIAKFAWHGRERLGLLRALEGVIALHALRWPDEIRSPDELAPKTVEITDKEIDEAVLLIDSMTRDDAIEDAEWATDRYTKALEDVIAAKAHGEQPPQAQEPAEPSGQVVDLMAALEQSVAQAKKSRTDGKPAEVHDLASAKKKTTAASKTGSAKKTTSKKSTAAKTTAKKTAAKKTAKTKSA
ncbi:Ku protein [Streptomyces sp. NPDC001904]|uniref:non-homologous end joining protein Ku n=1 Tax=Streptomyces sp. NPDC001904 TaxID=3154531 RepID=UPI003328F478